MARGIATALAVALAVVTLSTGLWSGEGPPLAVGESRELAPGWVLKNLGEYPANVPGYDKVRIVELTGQPGATIGPDEMLVPMFCTALKGEVTLELDGVKRQIKAGDSYVCAVGQKGGARNTGSEPYVERMHHLIKAGQ
jgi:quercetin dioxygenase-like cupin family protein